LSLCGVNLGRVAAQLPSPGRRRVSSQRAKWWEMVNRFDGNLSHRARVRRRHVLPDSRRSNVSAKLRGQELHRPTSEATLDPISGRRAIDFLSCLFGSRLVRRSNAFNAANIFGANEGAAINGRRKSFLIASRISNRADCHFPKKYAFDEHYLIGGETPKMIALCSATIHG
jgi:hypothetical protein